MHAVVAPLSLIVEGAEYERLNLAFAAMAKARVDSVVVTEHEEFAARFPTIAALALGNRLPSIGARKYPEAGELIGYGVTFSV